MLTSLYQDFIDDMIELQHDYYLSFLFIGIILASVLIYNQAGRKSARKHKHKAHHQTTICNGASSSACSVSSSSRQQGAYTYPDADCSFARHIRSPSCTSTSLLTPNQIYRKDDPETRYDDDGTRYQCISVPYRVVNNKVEIFMITSRKLQDYIFPGGGWEWEESGPDAARREAFEEAGVQGVVTRELLSNVRYTSDKGNKSRIWGYLLQVTKVCDTWPEPERGREWMSIDAADQVLSERRRIKFGELWRKAVEHFSEENLYHGKVK